MRHVRESRGLQRITIVQRFDNSRFFDLYVDLLTRPVPVRLQSNP